MILISWHPYIFFYVSNPKGYPPGQFFQFRSLHPSELKVKCQEGNLQTERQFTGGETIYRWRDKATLSSILSVSLYLLLPPLPPSPPVDTLCCYCLLFPCFLLLYSLLLLLYSLFLCLLSTYYFIFESSREDLLNPF